MCGVFGVFGLEGAERYAYFGIYALQHRGQESVGIAVSDGSTIKLVRKAGLVLEAIKAQDLEGVRGNAAIAHVRYSTAGDSGFINAQPFYRETSLGPVAVVHNGNLVNYGTLRKELEEKGYAFQHSSDTELFLILLEDGEYVPPHVDLHPKDRDLLPRIFYVMRRVKGAYSLLYLFPDKMVAVRDPMGFRPLLMGRIGQGILFSSESCSFDILRGQLWRELRPGEVLVVDSAGIRSYFPFPHSRTAMCIFELVYFSKPESYVLEHWVYHVRKRMGQELAREDKVEADVVIPVPDSGVVPALGYSQETGIPFEMGLIRNHYVGRSFIEPTQELRDIKVLMKLSPNRAVLEGKRVVVIDDSLVRGTTSKKIVSMLKSAGAKEVHLRIASPPVIGPCFYGIDTPTREELIANRMSLEDIRKFTGADTLRYLSLEGLRRCVHHPEKFCDACFSNLYPVEVEETASRIR
ncbi:amidophosphoribosyltransferase [Thermocrinis albus DSM 14484]|uniref:Amidophosphoribosyltransferase n=1 Tax=Thermocrinis albus (strain DSM 14484 / JCM 11386 / HI 11/12) TaxID=638303 RepID=D3SN61_THEAH|nr:amidophosphoribosyltransferase [Thermocrinis albus]ADC90191.1 amidophosphoribosyltransferase [Thermocrinis albus DSM 14484]